MFQKFLYLLINLPTEIALEYKIFRKCLLLHNFQTFILILSNKVFKVFNFLVEFFNMLVLLSIVFILHLFIAIVEVRFCLDLGLFIPAFILRHISIGWLGSTTR